MMTPDLHMHTTSSDGLLSPRELVDYAARQGVTLMAVTDHDTFDGALSLQGTATPIPVLTGTELSLRDLHGLHLLGYGLTRDTELHRVVKDLSANRQTRTRKMLEKLSAMGMPLDEEALYQQAKGSIGRMHIARAMLQKGYIASHQEAFDRYIGNDGPAYVAGERLCMQEALDLMHRSGFIPVLAHPAELHKDELTLRTLLNTWKSQGLMGVEVYHPSQACRGFAHLDAAVRRMGFLVTGGSDYHANDGSHGQPGCTAAWWPNALQDAALLLRAMEAAQQACHA